MNAYWMAAVVALWVLLAAVAVAQIGLMHKVVPLLRDGTGAAHPPAGIPVGRRPAPFEATTVDGTPAGMDTMLGRPAIVLLTGAGCEPCERLAARLRDEGAVERLPVPLVAILGERDDPAELALPPPVTVLRQVGRSAAAAFQSAGTPHAFAIDADGVVRASTVPARPADLFELAEAITNPLDGRESGYVQHPR